jgi:hypothetical protein
VCACMCAVPCYHTRDCAVILCLCVCARRVQGHMKFEAPVVESLAAIFRAIEGARARLGITDYTLSQTTLEQVLVRLSGAQPAAPVE